MQPVAITTYVVSSNLDKGWGLQHYLQYMSTIQALPSYNFFLEKISIAYTQRKRKYTHGKRFLVVCRVFNSVSVIQWLSKLLGRQNGQTFRFNRWKPRHWCGSENITLKVGTNRTRHHVGSVRTLSRNPLH